MKNFSPRLRLIFLISTGLLATSSASLFIRYAQNTGIHSFVIAMYRLLIATLILTVPVFRKRRLNELKAMKSRDILTIVLSGLFLGSHFASWITSLEYTSIVNSTVLVSTTPIWIALISPLFLKERLKWKTLIGMLVALFGSFIIAQVRLTVPFGLDVTGNFLALLGAIFAAGYLLIGRRMKDKISIELYLWLVYGVAALSLLILCVSTNTVITGFSTESYFWLLLTGLIPQLIGHSFTNLALRELSASFVAVTWLGEPIGSTLLGIVFIQEYPTLVQLLGGIIILSGIVISSTVELEKDRG